jgi:hypothetical protein
VFKISKLTLNPLNILNYRKAELAKDTKAFFGVSNSKNYNEEPLLRRPKDYTQYQQTYNQL